MYKLFLVLCLGLSVCASDRSDYSCGKHKCKNGKRNPCTASFIEDNNGDLKYPHSDPSKYVECFKPNGKKMDYKCRVQSCGKKQFVQEFQGCDIDECDASNGQCEQGCVNEEGTYHCNCSSGWSLAADGRKCVDIDECDASNGQCEQGCVNEEGTYHCNCSSGWSLAADGRKCVDIDECMVNNGGCSQQCNNSLGSFRCACDTGYEVDGHHCVDVDECRNESSNCAHICNNTLGTYICSCQPDFELDSDGRSCRCKDGLRLADDGNTCVARYEYAAACLPLRYSGEDPECFITLLSNTTTDVEINTIDESISITLSAGTLHQQNFDLRPHEGLEYKGISITSDEALHIVVYHDDSYYSDIFQIPPLRIDSDSFFTTAYVTDDKTWCGSDYKEFYLVISFHNNTMVSITQQDGTHYDLELSEYATFSQKTLDYDDQLASGTRIQSSKPVSIISGNLCIVNAALFGTYASIMPPIASLGGHYVLPQIVSDDDSPAGVSVSVVATEDNTVVESEGDVRSLNEGETALFEYEYRDRSIVVNCSQICLVAQYSKTRYPSYGLLMLHGFPEHQFYTSAYFSDLQVFPPTYLSLVVKGEEPGDDLFLNGVSLGYLTWTALDGFSSAELSISSGNQELESVNGRPFVAFIYGQDNLDKGAGYTLLPTESTWRPTTSSTIEPPTTPSPSDTYPEHTAQVNGTAFTVDGLPLTPQCALDHLNNLDLKTKEMMLKVNGAIGQQICLGAGDIDVVRDNAATFNQDSKTLIEIDHTLRVQGHHVINEVEACAEEIADYLNDHSNWRQPIFPPVEGCSDLEMEPEYFNTSSTFWMCENQNDDERLASTTVAYESKLSEVLSTIDGSDLDLDCVRAYKDEADAKAISMIGEIKDELSSSGCGDIVTGETYVTSFSAIENQAFFGVSFYYGATSSSTLVEFLACMVQVHEFTLEHENWSPGSQPGAPFLPVPPRCPVLEHDGPTLDDQGRKWTC